MGELLSFAEHRRTCETCKWHDAAVPCCRKPGGYLMDLKFTRCLSWQRKVDKEKMGNEPRL